MCVGGVFMRRSSIVLKVKDLYENLELNVTSVNSGGRDFRKVANWEPISDALFQLNEYSFVGDSIQKIFDMGECYQSRVDTFSIPAAEFKTFETQFNIVKAKCESFIDSEPLEDDSNCLYVRVPDNVCDLKELSEIVSDLNVVFNTCPPLVSNIGSLEFKGVEHGSNWVILKIGAAVVEVAIAMKWIADLISKCYEIKIQKAQYKNIELDSVLKLMEIEDNLITKYIESYNKNIEDSLRDDCVKKFEQIGIAKEKLSPEDQGKVTHSMKVLMDLLNIGVEFCPSNLVDDETKKMFPNHSMTKEITTSEQKLITIKKEKKED